jgi:hypothetical protein
MVKKISAPAQVYTQPKNLLLRSEIFGWVRPDCPCLGLVLAGGSFFDFVTYLQFAILIANCHHELS